MRSLVWACLRGRHIVAGLSLILLIAGGWLAAESNYDVFPEFVDPQVTVEIEAPGFAPEQVERLVTKPLEAVLQGAMGVETLRSESIAGLSVVAILFREHTDPATARQAVSEAAAAVAAHLPAGVGAPHLSPLTSSTMDLLKIGLVSAQQSPAELRRYGEWVLKPRLLAVPGVARISVYGGDTRQIQVQIDAGRLASYGLTTADVASALQHALGLPGGGTIDTSQQRLVVELDTNVRSAEALARTVVAQQGSRIIRVMDLANVTDAAAPKFGDALVQGRPGVLLTVSSQYRANTLDVTAAMEASLAELAPDMKARGIQMFPAIHRPATFVETALGNLTRALSVGGVLIGIILLLFLRDWRAGLISFLAIPISLLTAIAVLSAFGMSLNTMTLGGFAVALGILVDDAVIDLENILRRLRDNRALSDPQPRLQVILEASLEINGAIIFATLIILIVFLPVLLLAGVQGKFVGALALAVVLAVTASLIVALTITPALSALLLYPERLREEPRWLIALKRRYLEALRATMAAPRRAIFGLTAATVVAVGPLPFLSTEFMPSFREGHFVAQVSAGPGTSLQAMAELGKRISAKLLAMPEIATVAQQIGRAEQGEDTWGPYRSEFHIELKHDAAIDQDATQAAIRDDLEAIPGVQSEVLTFLGDRMSEILTGETAQFVIRLTGSDLNVLDRTGQDIAHAITSIEGVASLNVGASAGGPTVSITLDTVRLSVLGINPGEAADTVAAAFGGQVVGQVFAQDQPVDVAMVLPPSARADPTGPGLLLLRTGRGTVIPLGDVADIRLGTGRETIRHQDGQRMLVVTFNSDGRDPQDLMTEVRAAVEKQVAVPAGVILDYGGIAEAERAGARRLALLSAVTLALIAGLLTVTFSRKVLAVVALLNLPFSLIGGIVALAAFGQPISLGAMVGLVTVFGISARNAILMLSHFEHLAAVSENRDWTRELIEQGAVERLTPILMTALITALGLVPLAFGLGRAGYEIEAPLAIVVLGGLLSSSVLCLLVLPGTALWAVGRSARRAFPVDDDIGLQPPL